MNSPDADGVLLLHERIATAFEKRRALLTPLLAASNSRTESVSEYPASDVFRLFNGFHEDEPRICVDLFADTLVISLFDRNSPDINQPAIQALCRDISDFYQSQISTIHTILLKSRFSPDHQQQKGIILRGSSPANCVHEWDVVYPLDLRLNRDYSFYIDCALLRKWLIENAAGKSVLNTFAYTGSLGLAALAGDASKVVQTDLNQRFLSLATDHLAKDNSMAARHSVVCGDFFKVSAAMRHQKQLFDLVIIDPPFFSQTAGGQVDQLHRSIGLINKIRPLVRDGGQIVAINNALFLSGAELMQQYQDICADGYLNLRQTIPVAADFFGETLARGQMPADPAPFNHSTKIVVFDVHKK